MDPDDTLKEIRLIVARASYTEWAEADHARLVELIDGLDEWLTKGGFVPREWRL